MGNLNSLVEKYLNNTSYDRSSKDSWGILTYKNIEELLEDYNRVIADNSYSFEDKFKCVYIAETITCIASTEAGIIAAANLANVYDLTKQYAVADFIARKFRPGYKLDMGDVKIAHRKGILIY